MQSIAHDHAAIHEMYRESEKMFQEALEKARVGRIMISIAHRLFTIKKSDVIMRMDNGHIIG